MAESNRDVARVAACPGCGSSSFEGFIDLLDLPVHCMAVFPTPEQARALARADQLLALCFDCGLVFNTAFDEALLDYAEHHEDSQHHSPRFSAYAEETARDWVERFGLAGTTVCEVGCGKGGFLVELVRAGVDRAVGVDPGFRGDHIPADVADRIEVALELFRPAHVEPGTTAVVCRHTLEHIPHPTAFVQDMVTGMADAGTRWFLAEVPDVGRILREGAFWDLQYEHCSYFTPVTFAAMLSRAGLVPESSYLTYGDQYVVAEARYEGGPVDPPAGLVDEIAALRAATTSFSETVRATFDRWSSWFDERASAGDDVVVWGGGSKGLTFLNQLRPPNVTRVVDINPGLQGNYMGGLGLPIVAPAELTSSPPASVVLMNPVYLDEVRGMLDGLGLQSTALRAV